jgi:hypothetical protein
MLDALGDTLGLRFEPWTYIHESGVSVNVDGADAGGTVLVECWAHQGTPKGGQLNKPILDAFKLMWLANNLDPRPRLVLCLSDEQAARPFSTAKSWRAQALRDGGVEVIVVNLPEAVTDVIRSAQTRQVR